jgi:DinB family protein
MTDTAAVILRSLDATLGELLDGPSSGPGFVLNQGDRGLLGSLGALSADAASARPGGRSSIAAHVEHLRYCFELLNRSARGENPWAGANYATSWEHQQVTDAEWRILRNGLADEVRAWRAAWQEPREWDDVTMNNALSSAAHLAYHVGAIRQIDQAASGPKATD